MSGTASVPNSFAASVTATGVQLDADFGTIVAYINDPTNRNNYAADAGATNTVVLTFAPPVVGGYTAGLELAWKWAATNSGGVVLNANGLGNIALVNPDGTAMQAGQGVIGTIGKAVYDGTRAIYIAAPSPATQAQMETATASASFVYPSAMKWHPATAKAWGRFTNSGSATIALSHNIASVTRTGAGTVSVAFINPLTTANYPVIVSPGQQSLLFASSGLRTTAGFVVISADAAATPTDVTIDFVVYGDLP